jgi:20S proteasome alpha/beta subunit
MHNYSGRTAGHQYSMASTGFLVAPRPLKQRYPWGKSKARPQESAVTLCIAVRCNEENDHRIVCCSDAQVGTDYESSESEYKWISITPTACTMYSGPLVTSKDLIESYKKSLKKARFRLTNYKDILWKPMRVFLDANQHKEYLQENMEVSLLVVVLVEDKFRIVTIDSHGIRENSYFAAIGTGEDAATSMLRWRQPTHTTDLSSALYFAYEAKKLGERSPHVGKALTHLNILSREKNTILSKRLGPQEINELRDAFKRFGPQPIDPSWTLTRFAKPAKQQSPVSPKRGRRRQPPLPG